MRITWRRFMISVKGISKSFESFNALDDVTCDIKDGCIYGMVGSNVPRYILKA